MTRNYRKDWPRLNRETLTCIRRLTKQKGIPPTVRELAQALGVSSPSTVANRLNKLRDAGLIVWDEGKNRTIQLVEGK